MTPSPSLRKTQLFLQTKTSTLIPAILLSAGASPARLPMYAPMFQQWISLSPKSSSTARLENSTRYSTVTWVVEGQLPRPQNGTAKMLRDGALLPSTILSIKSGIKLRARNSYGNLRPSWTHSRSGSHRPLLRLPKAPSTFSPRMKMTEPLCQKLKPGEVGNSQH